MDVKTKLHLLPVIQICAVLAAVTEVIRSQGGKETETEYFAALVSPKTTHFIFKQFCNAERVLLYCSKVL